MKRMHKRLRLLGLHSRPDYITRNTLPFSFKHNKFLNTEVQKKIKFAISFGTWHYDEGLFHKPNNVVFLVNGRAH